MPRPRRRLRKPPELFIRLSCDAPAGLPGRFHFREALKREEFARMLGGLPDERLCPSQYQWPSA